MTPLLWDALGIVALGIVVSLLGRHLRAEHRRLFTDDPRTGEPRSNDLMEAGLRRAAVMLLTFGAILVIVGVALAANEAVRHLRAVMG